MPRWMLLVCVGLALILAGCGGGDPVQTVRQFHIAAITEDTDALNRVQDTSGVTTPGSDFKLLRDLLVFLTRTYKTTEPKQATKLVDAVCVFSKNDDYPGDGAEIMCAADLSQVFVPFLGDAARNVVGKPKEVIRYSMILEEQKGRWVVKSVKLPGEQLVKISQGMQLNLDDMNTIPGTE